MFTSSIFTRFLNAENWLGFQVSGVHWCLNYDWYANDDAHIQTWTINIWQFSFETNFDKNVKFFYIKWLVPVHELLVNRDFNWWIIRTVICDWKYKGFIGWKTQNIKVCWHSTTPLHTRTCILLYYLSKWVVITSGISSNSVSVFTFLIICVKVPYTFENHVIVCLLCLVCYISVLWFLCTF